MWNFVPIGLFLLKMLTRDYTFFHITTQIIVFVEKYIRIAGSAYNKGISGASLLGMTLIITLNVRIFAPICGEFLSTDAPHIVGIFGVDV